MIVGGNIEKMAAAELAEAAEKAALFARLSPAQKEQVIRVLRNQGHVVAFKGAGSMMLLPCGRQTRESR